MIKKLASLGKRTSTVHRQMYMGLRDTCTNIYQVQIDIIIYQIYQLVGGFLAKFVSSRISHER